MLFDERLTVAALKLADSAVQTEKQAAAIFASISAEHVSSRKASSFPIPTELVATFASYDWQMGQQRLQAWLPKIAQLERMTPRQRAKLVNEVDEALWVFGECRIGLGPQGLIIRAESDTIAQAAIRGVLPFLVPNGFPISRLGKCQLETCGRWFLRPHRAGTVSLYCTPKHSNLARVRRSRGQQP